MYKLTLLPQRVLIIYTDAFKSQKEGFTSPEAEVTGNGCVVPIIDVGNQTRVLEEPQELLIAEPPLWTHISN